MTSPRMMVICSALMLVSWSSVHTLSGRSHAARQSAQIRLVLADSAILSIMARDRATGVHTGDYASILKQKGRVHARARIDSLADSLTARIINTTASQGSSWDKATGMLVSLTVAGASDSDGVPYPGAIDRLIRVHKESRNEIMRMLALQNLPGLTDGPKALAYLREVATSPTDPGAHWAVSTLIVSSKKLPGADALVRELWDKKLVTERIAAEVLFMYGSSLGWKKPPEM